MKQISYILALLVILYACGGGENSGKKKSSIEKQVKEAKENYIAVADESIKTIFGNIPSPLEISVILKESSVDYNLSFLNKADNYQNYDTEFKKAVNLGIYGTDLGYINIYGQSQDAIDYVTAVRNNANDLNIGQFFDFSILQKLVSNSNNIDSLLLITTQNFNYMNHHLQEQKRADISALILAGGWLEALYITLQVFEKQNSAVLREKIGEQKIVLGQLWKLFEQFKGKNARMDKFYNGLNPIKTLYDQVSIKKVIKDPIVKEVDGVVFIEDQSETIVEMTDDVLKNISTAVNKFRTELVK